MKYQQIYLYPENNHNGYEQINLTSIKNYTFKYINQ